jgi:hypothetical protein
MPIVRAKGGLSAAELEGLRAAVTAGRKPKVTFTSAAGQIAGRSGQVVRFDDPGASDEWVVVRFGKDELPFAPTDLELPDPKAKVAPAKAAQKAETIEPPPWTPAAPPAPEPTRNPVKPAAEVLAPAKPPARKPAAGKKAPELVVTLTCQDNHWSVQAHKGTRALVKSTPVKASEALKMVALLDAEPVQAIVEELVESARADAEQQAERLRQELARVEAALEDLRAAR